MSNLFTSKPKMKYASSPVEQPHSALPRSVTIKYGAGREPRSLRYRTYSSFISRGKVNATHTHTRKKAQICNAIQSPPPLKSPTLITTPGSKSHLSTLSE